MKKTILLFAVIVFVNLIAKNSNGQLLIPGIKAGVDISNFQSPQFNSTSRKGIEAGLIFTACYDNIDILTEFTYSQKGAKASGRKFDGTISSDYVNYDLYFNSFSWSLIGNYYIIPSSLSIGAGPVFGMINRFQPKQLTEPEYLFGSANNKDSLISSKIFFDNLPGNFDYSLAFCISGGSEAFKVSLRYYLGLRNYYKKEDTDNIGLKMKNNLIQLSVSYSFLNIRIIS
jgi:hypothetical protein